MFNTLPSPNIPKGSELGLICTQTKLFITKGIIFNVNFAINSMYLFPSVFFLFFLNQGTCEIIFADRENQSVRAATLLWWGRGATALHLYKHCKHDSKPLVAWTVSILWLATHSLALIVSILVLMDFCVSGHGWPCHMS